MRRLVWCLALVAVTAALPAEPALTREGGRLVYANGRLALTIDAATGEPVALAAGGASLLVGGRAELAVGSPATWVGGDAPRVLAEHRVERDPGRPGPWLVGAPAGGSPGGTVLRLTSQVADWRLEERWRLWPESEVTARTAVWTYTGAGEGVVDNARLAVTSAPLPADGEVVLPASFPVTFLRRAELSPGRRRTVPRAGQNNHLVVVRGQASRQALLALTCGEGEHGWGNLVDLDGAVRIEHGFPLKLRYRPGTSFELGAQVLGLAGAETEAIVARAHEAFDRCRLQAAPDPPPRLDRSAVFSAHPGGSIGSGFKDTGGFAELTRRLPVIRSLGFTIVWLLPFWKGSVYAPVDYTQVDPSCGTEAELKALVDRAHGLGMKVLGDLIPHGPREESGLLKQHPEWIARDFDGKVTYTWGCLQCDYAHPGWQQYMAEHAVDWMRRVGLDGYRVDVAMGGPPNWQPYQGLRPSMSGAYGGRRLMTVVRAAMKQQDPNALLLAEGTSAWLCESSDIVYDFPWTYDVLPASLTMPPERWAAAAREWLDWQQALYPRGTRFLRYAESHDTIKASWKYGPARHAALVRLNCAVPGVPMLYDGEEAGLGEWLPGWLGKRSGGMDAEAVEGAMKQVGTHTPVPELVVHMLGSFAPTLASNGRNVVVTDGLSRIELDSDRGGQIRSVALTGDGGVPVPVLDGAQLREGRRKLFIGVPPIDFDAVPAEPQVERRDRTVIVTYRYTVGAGPARVDVTRTYHFLTEGRTVCRLELALHGTEVERASAVLAQTFSLGNAVDGWRVATMEGDLSDRLELSLGRLPVSGGSRYRHDASSLVWSARQLPLAGTVELRASRHGPLRLCDLQADPPDWLQDVRLTCEPADGVHPAKLDLSIRWLDGEPVTVAPGQRVVLSYMLRTFYLQNRVRTAGPSLHCEGSNYVVENAHYRLVVGRSAGGTIRELRRRTPDGLGPSLVDGLNTYTDVGIYGNYTDPRGKSQRTNARSDLDIEPDVAIRREGGVLVLSFTGTFRAPYADGRSVQRPYGWYRHEYLCDDSPRIGLKLGLRPPGGLDLAPTKVFAAHVLPVSGVTRWQAAGGDGQVSEAASPTSRDRVWQAREHGGLAADGLALHAADGPWRVTVGGGDPLQNVFLLDRGEGRMVVFAAPFDLAPAALVPRWYHSELALETRP